jgi:hypothetical protein
MTETYRFRTQDHETIQEWAERREAFAAKVIGRHPDTPDDDDFAPEVGALRLGFLGYASREQLEPLTWEQFFSVFDAQGLTFAYNEANPDGNPSNDYHIS